MSNKTTYETIFVARQPVFDAHNETWGYMMLFRDSENADRAIFSNDSEATMNLVANLPLCGGLGGSQAHLMVHFTPEDVIRGIPHAVPWNNTVIILEEITAMEETLLIALKDLKNEGYEIAINNFEGKPDCEQLAELADVLIVDMNGKDEADLAVIAAKGKKLGSARMIAKRVETSDDLAMAKGAGFTLFHGFFFRRPQIETGRKISSSKVTRLKLFEIIEKEEPDFDALRSERAHV